MIRHVTFGYLISMMSACPTMHWTDREADRPTPTDTSFTGKFDDYRPLHPESDAA